MGQIVGILLQVLSKLQVPLRLLAFPVFLEQGLTFTPFQPPDLVPSQMLNMQPATLTIAQSMQTELEKFMVNIL